MTARVLYALRLTDMTLLKCLVTDEHGSESLRVFDVRPGQLWIADRFYSNPEEIAWVDAAGGKVLVRYNRGALPVYDAEGRHFDVMAHVRSLQSPEAMAEWQVWVHPAGRAPIQGRLCAVRLPEEQAEKARQSLRREYGSKVKPEALEAAAWVMVFTTVARRYGSTPVVCWTRGSRSDSIASASCSFPAVTNVTARLDRV